MVAKDPDRAITLCDSRGEGVARRGCFRDCLIETGENQRGRFPNALVPFDIRPGNTTDQYALIYYHAIPFRRSALVL